MPPLTTHNIILLHPWNGFQSIQNKKKGNYTSMPRRYLIISTYAKRCFFYIQKYEKDTFTGQKSSPPSFATLLFTFEPASTFLPAHRCHGNGQLPVEGLPVNRARAEEQFNEGKQWIRSVCAGYEKVICMSVRAFYLLHFFLLFHFFL